ncbi:hypothetical protein KUTeg_003166 [Tegillarca granosa]|uniref:Uncharacterized protein n=1 Tax=Tegillarca granosa TaxID=220873 RepID=A0ABQ9FQT5_TEGGR|nr:hypothetical protein KUTeg_003166 [Tegillarca granosa]
MDQETTLQVSYKNKRKEFWFGLYLKVFDRLTICHFNISLYQKIMVVDTWSLQHVITSLFLTIPNVSKNFANTHLIFLLLLIKFQE